MKKKVIATKNAPKAVGPYSQAIRAGDFVYTAGQIALDPETGQMAEADVAVQTERVLQNLGAVLESAGSSLEHVVKTTVFLQHMSDFAAMNEVYARIFGDARPARSTVAVAALPLGALVEIEVVALVGKKGKKK
ncbi:MAG: RidA family protein [Anaerolineales bacterium]|nr:RidA family protein [Anaerolineales bacterium]MCB8953356.1 RidA family protein [Ardenticatenales bacterium]